MRRLGLDIHGAEVSETTSRQNPTDNLREGRAERLRRWAVGEGGEKGTFFFSFVVILMLLLNKAFVFEREVDDWGDEECQFDDGVGDIILV